MKTALPVLVIALSVGLAAPALAFDPAAVSAARRDLRAAVDHGDLARIMGVRARFTALSAAEPKSALLHYWVGVSAWRALPLQMSKDKSKAEQLGDDGLEHLESALAIDDKYAEALAVKGGLQGMMISLRPNSMMTMGPQSGAHLSRALSLAPMNPRIHLLNGVGILHKPVMFGGGPKPAMEEFQKAQELFAKETVSDSTQPDWGSDDAWTWEGRAAMQMKDYAGARAAFQHALEVNPDNGWVRTQLLPEAEKALGGKSAKADKATEKSEPGKTAAEGSR